MPSAHHRLEVESGGLAASQRDRTARPL